MADIQCEGAVSPLSNNEETRIRCNYQFQSVQNLPEQQGHNEMRRNCASHLTKFYTDPVCKTLTQQISGSADQSDVLVLEGIDIADASKRQLRPNSSK